MDKLKGVAKGGWHPEGKDGGKESWRGDFKGIGQVAGWVGKGKDKSQGAREHQARPLTTLKDPAQFGPPPRNLAYRGGASVPNAITSDSRDVGEPSSQAQNHATDEEEELEARAAEDETTRPAPPPVPYRADTTGLSTDHLPMPPLRRLDQNKTSSVPTPLRAQKSKPSLPPRLPPRQNSSSVEDTLLPPPPYNGTVQDAPVEKSYLNQGSLKRLGSAGVSVPGLSIGDPPNPWHDQRSSSAGSSTNPQLSELQSRFSKMSTSSQKSESPSQGTSFAQKQAALKTASSFRNDPSSVSLLDARNAASTANNFRQRHGDQVASGWQSANGLNQKYGIANNVNSYATGSASSQVDGAPPPLGTSVVSGSSAAAVKKKPPPPPPKKRDLGGSGDDSLEPPPLPLASKPR
ncbi:MAG: hypothetical protein M1830_000945 [Pleopsidium flavum]|nr:MAG: hypothetical protein M1830_000945 [Pleopsidium flavum]